MSRKHLLTAAIVLLVACWNSVGYHQGDEHFQILEFAAYKAGLVEADVLPWEFGEQMRPALQPGIAYLFYQCFGLLGEAHPYWLAFFLRLISAAVFLWINVRLYRWYAPVLPNKLLPWFALLLLFHWCTLYSGIRFSGENWSGLALILGLLVYPLPKLSARKHLFTPGRGGPPWRCFAAGLLFGVSFLFRYQLALAVLGFGAWLLFVGRERWSRLGLVISGGLVALAFGTVVDYWFYGEWVIAPWHYLRINVFEGVAATFGSKPWWGYFELIFERGIPPLSLFYLAVPLWFAYRYRRDPLTWIFGVFFVVHCLLSRKDLRFLFPLLPLLPIVLIAGVRDVQARFGEDFFQGRWVRLGVRFLLVINLLLVASVSLRPMTSETLASRYIYNHYSEPVTLFADGNHVYTHSNLVIRFYQRPGRMKIVRAPREEWPACSTQHCLYSVKAKLPNPPETAKLVYTNRPPLPETLNFGGWLDGMKWWYVYEVE